MKKQIRIKNRWDDPSFAPAIGHLEKAFALSREHQELMRAAEEKHGIKGPWISGIGQEHWPLPIRTKARELCNQMNWHSERANECRPPNVRRATMRDLRDFIRKRDGSGHYL